MEFKAIALQQISCTYARSNAAVSLDKPVAIKLMAKHLPADVVARLEASSTNGAVFLWGSKRERCHQTDAIADRNTLFLFRQGTQIIKRAVVIEKIECGALAKYLWGHDHDGETWATVYFFKTVINKVTSAIQLNEKLGRSANDAWRGLVVIALPNSEWLEELFQRSIQPA